MKDALSSIDLQFLRVASVNTNAGGSPETYSPLFSRFTLISDGIRNTQGRTYR